VQGSNPPLWKHQEKAVSMAVNSTPPLECLGIFYDIGTGKSRTAIEILRYLCARHGVLQRTLILAPKIVLTNWKREITRYSRIMDRDIVILTGSQYQRVKQLAETCVVEGVLKRPKIVITNYEALGMDKLYNMLTDWTPEVMIADEAHRLKNPEGKRAKAAIRLADKTKYRYALTGTPILNSAMDVFNVFRFLDKGQTFGTNFWKFRAQWFEDDNAGWSGKKGYFPKYSPRPETYAEFNKLIYRKALTVKKSECLDLPPFVRKKVYVELSPEQDKLYQEMKRDYLAWIQAMSGERKAVVAQMAVTKALRLQQIVTGYAKTEDGSVHKIKENPRLEALRELLEDLHGEHKIIVWSVFHENYTDIATVCKALGLDFAELHGKISSRERDTNIDRFCHDPKCRVLIGNQSAGGIGINLVQSDIAIYFSKNFSLEHDLQSEGRNYRGGSEAHSSVTRIDIVATNTIDELIAEALASKQDIASQILDWGKKL
jgi:SNF2 family DNA or RNA helicase